MRALAVSILIVLVGCGARSSLEVDPPPEPARPDASTFDTFTCRWSYAAEPRTVAMVDFGRPFLRGTLHDELDVGVALVGPTFVAFGLDGTRRGSTTIEGARLAWTAGAGWHLFAEGATACTATLWDPTLTTELDARPLFDSGCAFDPLGTEVAVAQASDRGVEVSAVGEAALDLRFVGAIATRSEVPPRVARGTDGTVWIGTITGGAAALHAIDPAMGLSASSGGLGASEAIALAPDRLRGGVVAAITTGTSLRVVRASVITNAVLVDELAALDRDPEPPVEIVTTETELLVARADGSYASVPLSGAAPRTIPSPEPGARRGVLAMREGTSAGAVVYPMAGDGFQVVRMRPLACNR